MQGDPEVLRLLNEQLTSELTAINQYSCTRRCGRTGFHRVGEAHPGRVVR